VQRLLNEARAQGYATATRARRVSDEVSVAVPIQLEDRVLAALTVRFSATAVPMKLALERFLPRLKDTAQKIRSRFLEQQASAGEVPARP
jgi:hypothetical protein